MKFGGVIGTCQSASKLKHKIEIGVNVLAGIYPEFYHRGWGYLVFDILSDFPISELSGCLGLPKRTGPVLE